MKTKALNAEFASRFYRWAQDDMRRELAEEFRLLRLVKGRTSLGTIAYFETLSFSEQLGLFEAMVKRFHFPSSLSKAELLLLKRKDQALLQYEPAAVDNGRASAQGRVLKLNRSRLAAAARKEIAGVLGPITDKSGQITTYATSVGNWTVSTVVSCGSPPWYFQHIHLPDKTPLVQHVSLLLWLGVSSQTTWDLARSGDELETVSSIRLLGGRFLEVAPRLLMELL